jgi:hypothetical protein
LAVGKDRLVGIDRAFNSGFIIALESADNTFSSRKEKSIEF